MSNSYFSAIETIPIGTILGMAGISTGGTSLGTVGDAIMTAKALTPMIKDKASAIGGRANKLMDNFKNPKAKKEKEDLKNINRNRLNQGLDSNTKEQEYPTETEKQGEPTNKSSGEISQQLNQDKNIARKEASENTAEPATRGEKQEEDLKNINRNRLNQNPTNKTGQQKNSIQPEPPLNIPKKGSDKSDKKDSSKKDQVKTKTDERMPKGIKEAKNIAKKAMSGDAGGSAEAVASVGARVGTNWALTTLWGSVWLDWTLLSLIGLNAMLVGSLFLPNYFCQFGEDYALGKLLRIGGKTFAKIVEIIILMIINMFVIAIIAIIIYTIYHLTTVISEGVEILDPWTGWDLFNPFRTWDRIKSIPAGAGWIWENGKWVWKIKDIL